MDCSLPGSSVYGIPGKNTGVGCHSLLQGIFLTQGSNLSLWITDKFFNVCSTKDGIRCFLCLNLFNHYTHHVKVTLLSLLYRVSLIAQLVKNPTSMQDLGLIPGIGRSAGEGTGYPLQYSWVSLVAQLVKNQPAIEETWVWSLFREHSLERIKATHSSILAWRIPWTSLPGHKESDTIERLSLSLSHYWIPWSLQAVEQGFSLTLILFLPRWASKVPAYGIWAHNRPRGLLLGECLLLLLWSVLRVFRSLRALSFLISEICIF